MVFVTADIEKERAKENLKERSADVTFSYLYQEVYQKPMH